MYQLDVDWLQRIQEGVETILAAAGVDSLQQVAAEVTVQRFGFDRASVWRLTGHETCAGWGWHDGPLDLNGRDAPAGIAALLTRLEAPDRLERRRGGNWSGLGYSAVPIDGEVVMLPLRSPHGLLGWLLADNEPTGRPLDDDACRALALLAAPLGQALSVGLRDEQRIEFSDGMRQVIEILDQLEACDDSMELCRLAVELTRERLGLDRTGLYLDTSDPERLQGTFGTDLQGRTTDERMVLGLKQWKEKLVSRRLEPFELTWERYVEFQDGAPRHGREGWIAITPIRSRRRALGVFCNDTALTGRPVDAVQQHLVSTFCSLFGALFDRKQAEAARRKSDRLLRLLVDHAPVILFATDLEGNLTLAAGKTLDEVGIRAGNLLDHFSGHPVISVNLRRALAGESFTDVVEAGGRHFYTAYSPLLNDQREITGLVGVSTEVTEQVLAQRGLREAKEAAEAANRSKDDFLARISHEVRTPLNGIIGMARLALQGPLQDEQRHYLEVAAASADWLRVLLDDILEFSAMDSVEPSLVQRPFSLRACVAETILALAPSAGSRGLELLHRIERDVPDALLGDGQRFRQILSNLLANAIKFTPTGHVLVRLRAAAVEPERVALELVVEDTGIGIPEDQQQRIFEPFVQGQAPTDRDGGVGLGLAIVHHLARRMGGGIEVDSRPGEGSRFVVRLQFDRQPHAVDPIAPAPAALRGKAALLINGSAICRQVIEEMLGDWDIATVPVAETYRPGEEDPAVILLDAHRANHDGWDRVAEIAAVRGELPVIMLKPPQRVPAEERATATVIKPVRQLHLLNAIAEAAGLAEPPEPPAEESEASGPAILVVEDHEPNRQLVAVMLEKRHYRHRLVASGEEALQALARERFDLVLLDLQMPGLDGFEVSRRIRASGDPAIARLPIIALTAHAMRGDRERCLAAGMDEYLAKPFRPEDLFTLLERVLELRCDRT